MINLRTIKKEDVTEIECWPAYKQGFEQMDYALRAGGWLTEYSTKSNTWIYAAESDKQIVGFSLLSVTAKGEAEFRIAIHPHRTGLGFGRETTLATLRKGFGELNMDRIYLIVRKNNYAAMKLYEGLGFKKNGESTHSIQGKPIEFFDMDISKDIFRDPKYEGDKMNAALMLVDMQQDYFPQGRMELVGSIEASLGAERLLSYFRKENLPIIHIQHVSIRKDATFFLPDTEGINFHENVRPVIAETIVKKHFPNSFRDTNLNESLTSKGVDELVICGMMSHMCIDATVRSAFDKGYSCFVAHNACATKDLVFDGVDIPAKYVHGAYMAALAGVYAKVLSAEEIIEMIMSRV
jgi:nicotinamidase-related amidase/RimJ/RimL family protein N-acetyltransferase